MRLTTYAATDLCGNRRRRTLDTVGLKCSSIAGASFAVDRTAVDVGLVVGRAGTVALDVAAESRRVTSRSRP